MQHRHKVRVCVSVVHLLADEIENLGGTFGVYMYLEEEEEEKEQTLEYLLRQVVIDDARPMFCLSCSPIQNVLTEPAHRRSAASRSSLNACGCERK